MRRPYLPALALAAALLCGCAGVPPDSAPRTPISADYVAAGDTSGVRAFVYGKRTVLEIAPRLFWLTIEDADGAAVPYEREGRFYRLPRKLDNFTVRVNTRVLSFHARPAAPRPLPAAAPARAAPPAPAAARAVLAEPAGVAPDRELAALVTLSAAQAEEVREAIAAAGDTAETRQLLARLERVERRLAGASAVLVRVQFDSHATGFAPDPALARPLVAAAHAAERVNVRGRTDARVAGPDDPRIALARAVAARTFLIDSGVEPAKIRVFAQPAGDFIAPARSEQGRALNRRVEIELVTRGLASRAAVARPAGSAS
ncbi:hypothetical protein [Pseudoduganella chitinolytica]|uniref:OmpA-like domain-containing protein n=1 Tax=Pseudoduganella chitinolytica TaxID=34070 RepID=A0ABY8B8T9_9BURK|nr:hypothetical protein [Pseudoduganella chitinolytica]WEF31458.1 hypothetical protein PX653_18590 [Pseudoduganella chitinolytica]